MVGDAGGGVGSDVRHPELLDKKLRELEDFWRDIFDVGGEAFVVRQLGGQGVELADHADAGAGGRHDGLVVFEDLHEAPDERYRLALVAGVEVHLATAGLLEREFHPYPEAFENLDRRPAGLGKEGVVEAGDKERRMHGRSPSLPWTPEVLCTLPCPASRARCILRTRPPPISRLDLHHSLSRTPRTGEEGQRRNRTSAALFRAR